MFLPSIGDVSIRERKVSDKCEDSLVETHPASTEISLWSLRHHSLRDLRHNLTSLALIITPIWSSHHRCHWCQHHGLVRSGTMGEGVVAPPSEGSRGQDGGSARREQGGGLGGHTNGLTYSCLVKTAQWTLGPGRG